MSIEIANITISVDDVHPELGWGLQGDKQLEYFDILNKEFGAKFTLFIPSNYHGKFPLRDHKEWVEFLLGKGYFELAAHGHLHQTLDPAKYGECEFFELDRTDEIQDRIEKMVSEWDAVGYMPKGWRNPGWLCSPESCEELKDVFEWSAIHYEHNRDLDWGKCKTILGADGIHEVTIGVHDDKNVMLQSHIAGDWNHNIWNADNFERVQHHLQYLVNNFPNVQFKTLSEL